MLELEGFVVDEAMSADVALKRIASDAPDVIVQDLLLPDVAGFDLLHEIRRLASGREVPVIALSAFDDRLVEARVSKLGFAACLRKPQDIRRLPDVIRRALAPPPDQTH
jgi:DNA-binding response OmpR family regulator